MERLDALDRIRQLRATIDTSVFDDISRLAKRTLRVSVAMVSLVTDEEQIFAGIGGLLPDPWQDRRSTPLTHSFCQHVTRSGKSLVIPDSRENPLVSENLGIRDLNIIAYAGVPLTTASGFVIGSFCAIDDKPRLWTTEEVETLRGLAALTVVEIELRLARNQLQGKVALMQASEEGRGDRTRLLVHDLRTPLNSLLLGLKTIPLLGELNLDQQETLDLALRGGQILVALVDDLLDTSAADMRGADSLRLRDHLDPADLLASAVAQVTALAAHGLVTLSIEAAIPESGNALPGTIRADQDKIVRALVNLLSNAVKSTPAGGQVSISARIGEDKDWIVFTVRDTGVGISREDQKKLFERFTTVSRQRSGSQRSSGIGLFFVKGVAEAHGGRIEVESEPGAGSRFLLTIPRRPGTAS